MGKNNTQLTYMRSGQKGRPRKAIIDGKQQCSTCLEWKELSFFGPSGVTASGLETRCNKCSVARVQERRCRTIQDKMKWLYKCHKNCFGFKSSPRRKQMAADSCVTVELLMALWNSQEGRCALTGVPMTHADGKGASYFTNVSIDRIDNSFGYIPDNVRLICRGVNTMRGKMTDRELFQWCVLILNGPINNPEKSYLSRAEGRN